MQKLKELLTEFGCSNSVLSLDFFKVHEIDIALGIRYDDEKDIVHAQLYSVRYNRSVFVEFGTRNITIFDKIGSHNNPQATTINLSDDFQSFVRFLHQLVRHWHLEQKVQIHFNKIESLLEQLLHQNTIRLIYPDTLYYCSVSCLKLGSRIQKCLSQHANIITVAQLLAHLNQRNGMDCTNIGTKSENKIVEAVNTFLVENNLKQFKFTKRKPLP